MSYTVLWKPPAEARLAYLWTNAPDRGAITNAANTLDALLRLDPLSQGESHAGATRVMFEAPLGVHYKVDPGDRMVYVLRVWRT